MSEPDGGRATVAADGVTVEKSFEFDEFPVPAVVLTVDSRREDAATVRLADPLPEGVSTEDVGFNAEYGEQFLSIGDGEVVLEREFRPGEEVVAVYGLRGVDAADLDAPVAPEIETVSAEGSDDDSSRIVRDVIPGIAGGGEVEDDEEVEQLELQDPAVDDSDLEPSVTVAGSEGAGPDVEGSLVAALAAEIRTGSHAEADVEALREALVPEVDGSVEARIQQLQAEQADLRAYADALEEFLDENGTARQLLSELREEVESYGATVEAVEETTVALEDDLAATRSRLADLEERVDGELDALGNRVEEASTEVEDLRTELEELREEAATDDLAATRDRLADLEETVDGVTDDLEEVADIQQRLQSVFAGETDEP